RVRRRVCGREDIDPEGFFTVWTAKESVIKYYGKNDWSFTPVGSREELSEAFPEVDLCFFRIGDCVAAVCAGKNAVFPIITEVDI
ncbi:MAG: 4'-phosphopantetheinyl transferase superfamily protein, partial [Firmicutes bacterium]|nr:4'-phosphopantetheinyl transferase superfamily protein [Bacillota bacterium]